MFFSLFLFTYYFKRGVCRTCFDVNGTAIVERCFDCGLGGKVLPRGDGVLSRIIFNSVLYLEVAKWNPLSSNFWRAS